MIVSCCNDTPYAFVVATHIDKHHVHNHIIICSTDLEAQHKYRDVKRSAKDIAQISDRLCRQHGLSVVTEPQEKTMTYDKWQGNQRKSTHRDSLRMTIDAALRLQPDGFDALMQMLEEAGYWIKLGAHISVKPPDSDRYIRLKSLGPEYDEDSLRRTLAGDHVHIPRIPRSDYTDSQVKQLIDIDRKLREGKGKGYEVWATRNNIDAKAQSVIFLKENHIGSMDELESRIHALQSEKSAMSASIRAKRNRMNEISRQRQAIRDYRRTKEVYVQYRESGWSAEFYENHREEIETHKKAQAVYSSLEEKMPMLKELTVEYESLREKKDQFNSELENLKSQITALNHIQYNFNILLRDEPITP